MNRDVRLYAHRDVTPAIFEMVLLHAVRCEEVFRIAREHLTLNLFHLADESYHQRIWALVLEHYERHGALPTFETLHAKAMAAAETGVQATPNGVTIIDQIVRWIFDETQNPASSLTPNDALEALEQILVDRHIVAPIISEQAFRPTNAGCEDLVERLYRQLQVIRGVCRRQSVPLLGEGLAAYEARLDGYRGRQRIGLQTGLPILDDRTCGIRRLILLGAAPGVGKSVYALQVTTGVCRHSAEHDNQACALYLSLDMDADDVRDRLHCYLAGIDWKTYRLGSQELRGNADGPRFSEAHLVRLEDARRRIAEWQLDRRLAIVGRDQVGELSASKIAGMARALKDTTGAAHCLIIIDYLQLLPVPEETAKQGDLEADKHRVRMVQQVVDASKGDGDRPRDAVIAICEARKPGTSSPSRHSWGVKVEDLMGSARLGYAADAVLLMRPMDDHDLVQHYGIAVAGQLRDELAEDGISPLIITLAKGRDGMVRGCWPAEFQFRESRISEGILPRPDSVPRAAPAQALGAAIRPFDADLPFESGDILGTWSRSWPETARNRRRGARKLPLPFRSLSRTS